MSDFQNELIGFTIIAIVIIVLAFFTQRIQKKDK
jgi:hypothetical protein